jgi:pyrroloquinoline-quinone synthase
MSPVYNLASCMLQSSRIFNNPYLSALASGTLNLDAFRCSQEQFFFAVTFFSRPIAALLARIPNLSHRMMLLGNIIEEHGNGEQSEAHHNTFIEFLNRIGANIDNTQNHLISSSIYAFNNTLTAVCTLEPVEVGVSMMGIIDRLYFDLYQDFSNIPPQ